MLRWYDSISPWRIQSNVQRKLGSVDNREWTNSLLLDYLPIKPMHIQQLFILWIVILIIHSNKFFGYKKVFFLIIMIQKWEQYYKLWSIINVTLFHFIHLLLLLNIIKNYRCEQIISFVYYFQITWMVDWTGYLNELKISWNAKHASTHH